ncbi:helix-turn-helix transcriptional regulator [Pseudomonas sp. gcc21]|uniref:helix-turn-helix domain-containing protein n=1 Tax=Pseudomonas sp. gcc21 TaxID=2726989 RepID=UPI001451B11B|nr:AraC family transcriptional regulator [Pseudomonas sp. gcc21]QJD58218.1 helix-turn-helix transcriptional regulator [Pseudomonas sp. gcc21]
MRHIHQGLSALDPQDIRPFGHLAHILKDQLYWLERGHLFTSPCVSVGITQRFYVMLLMTACGTPFRLKCGEFDQTVQAVAIAPGELRSVHAPGIKLVSVHLNPLHDAFPAFASLHASGPLPLDRDAFVHLDATMDAAYLGELSAETATQLHDEMASIAAQLMPAAKKLDARINSAMVMLREEGDIALDELSSRLGLSYHWMSRLFSDTVGLPLRTYCHWLKLHRATQLLLNSPALVEQVHRHGYLGAGGGPTVSLTELAHDAGFTDSAHMAHTISELCGGPLSHFLFSGNVRLHLPGKPCSAINNVNGYS